MGNHEFDSVSGTGGDEPYAIFNGNNAAGNLTFPAITGANGVATYDFTYSYELAPGWLLVVLNTSVNFNTQTAASQATNLGNWIDTWRAANGGHGCVIVALHTARWSTTFSGSADNGPNWVTGITPVWDAAIAHHVDIWLQGHVHAYEEFEKLDDQGNVSSAGIKTFTVGAGGRGQVAGGWSNIDVSKRLDYRASAVNGILKLALYDGSFGYKFEQAGSATTPTSSITCNVP